MSGWMGVASRRACLLAAATGVALTAAADETGWRMPDPASTLVIDTAKGRIVIELHAELAPLAAARIEELAARHFYDGMSFYRVVDGFVAQTGPPGDDDAAATGEANLAPEFTARLSPAAGYVAARTTSDGGEGFVGAMPAAIVSAAESARRGEGTVQTWGAYCTGTVGIARDEAFDSGNATFFMTRGPARRLERLYTAVGVVIAGREVAQALAVGEPPDAPDVMTRVRLLGDLPEAERPKIEVMVTGSAAFKALVDAARAAKGADFSVCDVVVPVRGE